MMEPLTSRNLNVDRFYSREFNKSVRSTHMADKRAAQSPVNSFESPGSKPLRTQQSAERKKKDRLSRIVRNEAVLADASDSSVSSDDSEEAKAAFERLSDPRVTRSSKNQKQRLENLWTIMERMSEGEMNGNQEKNSP